MNRICDLFVKLKMFALLLPSEQNLMSLKKGILKEKGKLLNVAGFQFWGISIGRVFMVFSQGVNGSWLFQIMQKHFQMIQKRDPIFHSDSNNMHCRTTCTVETVVSL